MRENKTETKKALGQGLAAILGENIMPEGYETKSAFLQERAQEPYINHNISIQELPINSIKPNPNQPR